MMQRTLMQSGLVVNSADGSPLGTVTQCDAESFTIGKGGFFEEDYRAGYDEILAYRNGEIFLTRHDEQLTHERRQIPAIGAAVPFALEEQRELQTGFEVSDEDRTGSAMR